MSVSAGSARALSSLRNLYAAGKTDCNPEQEAVVSIIGDSCLRVRVKNTFIDLEHSPSPLSVKQTKSEPNTAWSSDPLSSLFGASSSPGAEGVPAEEREHRTQVAFCSTPSPRSPASQLAFIHPLAPPAEPASPSPPSRASTPAQTLCQPAPRPVFVQAPLLPTIWPLAALAGTWPGPLARLCAEEGSGPPQGLRARQAPVGRRPVRPSSMPTVPLQSRLCSTADGFVRVRWTVDARKLRGSDKQLVSPPLDVDLGLGSGPAVFKIMLTASGGCTFSKSGGVGCVQVKCCSELGEDACTKVRISIGREEPRGPVPHCFSSIPVFSLPKELAECDFRAAVERQSNSMVVNVDVSQFI